MTEDYGHLLPKHTAAINEWAPHNSYCFVELPDGALACVHRLLYTHAIIHDVSARGCGSRWCYGSFAEAAGALADWAANFETQPEPVGWIRRLPVGRFAEREATA